MSKKCKFKVLDNNKIADRTELEAIWAEVKSKPGLYSLEIRNANKRSLSQNAFYWLLLTDYIQPFLLDSGCGNITSAEIAHEYCKQIWGLTETIVTIGTNEIKNITRSTSSYTTIEWSGYIDRLNVAFAEVGLVLPDPVPPMSEIQKDYFK